MKENLSDIHQAAIEVARMAGEETLKYFGKAIKVERKKDRSPVTIVDRKTEDLMRAEIESRFPGHGIVGEEFDNRNSTSEIQWILDPIDGTKSFIHEVPLYTCLIGILYQKKPISGIIYAPALDELCEAYKGGGARMNGEKCRVQTCSSIAEATFLTTDITTPKQVDLQKPFERLLQKTKLHRTWGDAYGHMMIAAGRADIMFDPMLNIWDAAALLPILQEAGGAFCDINGKNTIQTGNGISCSKELLPDVLRCFE